MPPIADRTHEVRWHDLECGGYDADLPLWRELAAQARGPVLDVGAGTGRVALDLARAGHTVTALDRDAGLLAALRARAGDLAVTTVVADARDFDLGARFALCLAPMQTAQILDGPPGRAGLLSCAHGHLAPGGVLAAALADPLDGFEETTAEPPLPDIAESAGWIYSSQPVAVRPRGDDTEIHRRRQTVSPDGVREESADVVRLDRLTPADLEREAGDAGFTPLPRRLISATQEHVGSTVVMLRA
jgi:SAM-dependent methyltransferase